MENELNVLSNRAGFNTALRHFKSVTEYVSQIGKGVNLADLINSSLDEGEIERYQVKSILNALLLDKFRYAYRSHNLEKSVESADTLINTISHWGNINIVLAYFHPQAGLSVINPKKKDLWESVLPLTRDELTIIYSGPVADKVDENLLLSSINDFLSLLYGNKVESKSGYIGKVAEVEQPQVAQVQALKRRVTPRYSVQVTNELFHNGNVEAWKRIVDSYKSKYTSLDVLIWYENERINDINALFKWGKVKHGGSILFSVAGEDIRDVSKLQRYLFEGASPRFENFLHGAVGRILDLF